MKLFVDDQRDCPKGWVLARTIDKAIRILDTQNVSEVSLDYDIKCGCSHCRNYCAWLHHTSYETFEPVARYLALVNYIRVVSSPRVNSEYLELIKIKVHIHTANFDGGKRMAKILGMEYVTYIYNEEDYEA